MFHQTLIHEDDDVLVSYLPHADVAAPSLVHGRPLIEPGSPIVWFTFPGEWHDIGRCHSAAGAFTGLYANVLTPVRVEADVWTTTDLLLDVALLPDRTPVVLDREELLEARREGWLDAETAERAEAEAARLVEAASSRTWPPPIVEEWTLERARDAIGERS